MARPLNPKCIECAKHSFKDYKPDCYKPRACEKKKCYYRKLDKYRQLLRNSHTYLRFKGDKCLTCKSTDNLEVHHIKPQTLGGDSFEDNLITVCKPCHNVLTSYHRALRLKYKYVLC